MIEFKFSCPGCGQHIQCNDAYCGRQISCPTCRKSIVVPPATGTAAPAPTAGNLSISRPIAPAPAAAAFRPPPTIAAAPKKSSATKIIALVVGLVVAVGAVFGVRWYLNRDTTSDPTATAKTKATQPGANNTQTPSAPEILQKVTEQYDSLTSYSASGKNVSIIDMSGVDMKNIPGMPAKLPKDAKAVAMSKPQRMEGNFSVKLGKPNFYRVEWEGQMGPVKNKGAVWSAGEGDFLLMSSMGQPKYSKMKDREIALASATGISGGAAGTMPGIFFKSQSSQLNLFKGATRGADETIDGEDCYVLTGNVSGMKIILWINQSTSLIKQKQMVLGGELKMPDMNDATVEEGLKQLGGNPTPEQKAQTKAMMKNMKAMTSQLKGTMTETYSNIEINKPVAKEDFKYAVPAGTKLSKSLF